MSFFAILIALLLEQVRPLAHDNPVHAALRGWMRSMRRNFDTGQSAHAWVAWMLAVAVPALISGLIHWALGQVSALLAFIWLVAVLYLTLGFRQFSHHFSDIRQALEAGDEALARERFARWLNVDASTLPRAELLRQFIVHSVLSAHRHVFGVLVGFVLLWVLGLGPAGAVLYRLAEYVSRRWRQRPDGTPSEALESAALGMWRWIDLVPSRVTALGFAVVGNFEEAVAGWRSRSAAGGAGSDDVVLAAAGGAINLPLLRSAWQEPSGAADAPQLAHLGSVVGLVWRAVVLWMLLLALLSLARLVG
ncbi:MAG: CobD/CbiB family protein [Burkholderiales bacterium]|nr:MAG: CobD/CbiB family protein [Burkholderiales bacterium]